MKKRLKLFLMMFCLLLSFKTVLGQISIPIPPIPSINKTITVWNGESWSHGEPNLYTKAIIKADYNTNGIFEASEIEIKDGAKLIVNNGDLLKLQNNLNDSTAHKIVLASTILVDVAVHYYS